MSLIYETIVIGAGPSGLVASYYLVEQGKTVLLLEMGDELKCRLDSNSKDVSSGTGGAGLYSDGKFSYYPSATNLWKLGLNNEIEAAYNDVHKLLNKNNIKIKKWTLKKANIFIKSEQILNRKYYDSTYINEEKRKNLLNHLIESIGSLNIINNIKVVSIKKCDDGNYEIRCANSKKIYKANTILYAGGRYGGINFKTLFNNAKMRFIKYEIGVRIECPSDVFLPYKDKQVDYKYISDLGDSIELRTFCCCRNGNVLKSTYENIVTFNGSSDGDKTQRSNIGINIRFNNENIDKILLEQLVKIVNGECKEFQIGLNEFINSNGQYLGCKIDPLIKQCIFKILGETIKDNKNVKIYGPTVEGIGYYPQFNNTDLKVENENLWIAGDCTGTFRGLTASLVSGFFSGRNINKYLENENVSQQNLKKLKVKFSSTDEMKLIFTAQSKVYFYCRDAICQFVLEQNLLPINPFRIFDYFLSDRVDRDIIRRGNNQLIKKCEELWVFGIISDGVLFEIAHANNLNMPIRYFTIGTKISDIHEISVDEVTFEPEVHAPNVKKNDLIKFIKGNIDKDSIVYEQTLINFDN